MRHPVGDLDNLPPLKWDEQGRPQFANLISNHRRRCLTEPERKVRFLLAYNVFGANEGLACREAGVDRKTYKGWLKTDAKFKERWSEARDEIADRLQGILNEVVGLTSPTLDKDGKPIIKQVNHYVLLATLKQLKPELFDGDSPTGGGLTLKLGVPRPQRPALGGDRSPVQPDPEAGTLPH